MHPLGKLYCCCCCAGGETVVAASIAGCLQVQEAEKMNAAAAKDGNVNSVCHVALLHKDTLGMIQD